MTEVESAEGHAFLLVGGPADGQLVKVNSPQHPVVWHDARGQHTYIPDVLHLPFSAYYQEAPQ
jgi:hypothetical protein